MIPLMCELGEAWPFYGQNLISIFFKIFFVFSQKFELISWKAFNRQVSYFDVMGHVLEGTKGKH